MTNALEYVLAKFPDHRVKIIDLFDKDEDFRILCEDYLTSMQTVEHLRANLVKSNPMEEEFVLINQELETELTEILNSERRGW